LTGYAFMKMLLGALGYDAEIEGYTGPNWSINVAKQAIGIGLNASLEKTFNGVEYVTREEAALYAFNTLKADLVEYDTKITADVNGTTVSVGNSNAKPQEWTSQMTRNNNIYDDTHVQFAEQYFNKLVLREDMEVFGRPDREWKYDGDDIGTYVNMDLFKQEYTTEVTGKDLYDLLGSNTCRDYTFEIHVDGEETEPVLKNSPSGKTGAFFTQENLIRSNTETIGATGNGVLTQVFVDNDKEVETVWIAVINTYLAKAVDDYNEKKDEATYKVWSLKDGDDTSRLGLVKDATKTTTIDLTVSGEDFSIEDVKKDDITLVHVADGGIQEFVEPEIIDETTISAFKRNSWVNAESTQYDYASSIQYDPDVLDNYDQSNMKNTNYRIFLDEYGYAVGIEIIEEPNQYVFLTGIDTRTSNLANKTAEGYVINTDGTAATVTINMDKSKNADGNKFTAGNEQFGMTYTSGTSKGTGVGALMNTWCRFTVDAKGVYTLFEVPNDDASWANGAKSNNSKGKAAQGRNHDENTASGGGQGVELLTLDKSHLYLRSDITSFSRVYTNDDTTFLMAETDQIVTTNVWLPTHVSDTGKSEAVIINGVESAVVGAQNVNLKAWDAQKVVTEGNSRMKPYVPTTHGGNAIDNVSNGVYSLFDKDGYVIAAVVVGEDDGTTTNFAFVISSNMEQESYSKDDDEYTWTRQVIINGEEVTLTEKGDTDPSIANMGGVGDKDSKMKQGFWAEVKYDANGNVRSVKNLSLNGLVGGNPWTDDSICPTADFDGLYNAAANWKYIDDIANVETATDDKSTVLLWDNLQGANKYILVEGSTLQVRTTTNDKDGFSIARDAKTVLIQDGLASINGDKFMNDIQYFTGGNEGAKRAVDRLEKNHVFEGFVGAVLENGQATSIIIYDKTPYNINQGGNNGGNGGSGFEIVTRGSNNNFVVRYYDPNFGTNGAMTASDVRDYAVQKISEYFNGVTVKNTQWSVLTNSGTLYLDDGTILGEDVNVVAQRVVAVSVDGDHVGYVDADVALTSAYETNNDGLVKIPGVAAGDYMVNTLGYATTPTAGASVTVTSGGVLDFSAVNTTPPTFVRDVNVYTEIAVTLKNPSGIKITTKDVVANAAAATGNITPYNVTQTAADMTVYVAKGVTIEVVGGKAADNTNHRLTATVGGDTTTIASKLVATTGGSPATDAVKGEYKVEDAVTLDETTGEINVEINGHALTLDGTETNADLKRLGQVISGMEGGYLVDLATKQAVTGKTAANVTGADLVDGGKYEFGYYKVTMPADIDAALTDTDTLFTNGAIAWTVTGVTTPADGADYYLKPGAKVVATVTADAATAGIANATVVGGTGAVADVVDATRDDTVDATATMTANAATVTIDNNNAVFNDVELTFTWTVAAADIADTALTVTATNA
ncbi:MAG: hypothetical protein HFG09_01430, partial [Oscillibacter sp.]|nr:hypothetical protein [Oscillibacter sp.]